MSDKPYTDDDVTAAAAALVALVRKHTANTGVPWFGAIGVYGAPNERDLVAAILAAVAPAIAARALREAADVLGQTAALARIVADTDKVTIDTASEWLRARAEDLER